MWHLHVHWPHEESTGDPRTVNTYNRRHVAAIIDRISQPYNSSLANLQAQLQQAQGDLAEEKRICQGASPLGAGGDLQSEVDTLQQQVATLQEEIHSHDEVQ